MGRFAEIKRKTKETEIELSLFIDDPGESFIDTGIGFFDHMLISLCHHGGFRLNLTCKGDLGVDCHHSIEDVGIVLGKGFNDALGNKEGICRFGSSMIPMDEALASCNLDISNRPYLVFNADFKSAKIGGLDTQMIREFFYAFAMNAKITLHLNLHYGENDHHIAECIFKNFAYALKEGIKRRAEGLTLSTKGSL